MKLTNEIKDRILGNSGHLLDEEYGRTFKEMKISLEKALARYVSDYREIQKRKELLEKYPDYMTPTSRAILLIPIEGNRYDTEFRFDMGFEFAQKHKKDEWGCKEIPFCVTVAEIEGDARELAYLYKDRIEEETKLRMSLSDVLKRVTTSNQLLREEPRCSLFFDDEGQFYIPDFRMRSDNG